MTTTPPPAAVSEQAELVALDRGTIVSISVFSMHESCERTTFYVRATTDEGLTKEVESHRTGSIYTNREGLSIEEARDRALIDAATWADFLGIEPTPFVDSDGVTHEPSMTLSTYGYQRAKAASLPQSKAANP